MYMFLSPFFGRGTTITYSCLNVGRIVCCTVGSDALQNPHPTAPKLTMTGNLELMTFVAMFDWLHFLQSSLFSKVRANIGIQSYNLQCDPTERILITMMTYYFLTIEVQPLTYA